MGRIVFAGLCIVWLAQAVDARPLPKSEPAPGAEACDGMGPGFVRLAGSGTCVKLSGNVRLEFSRQSGGSALLPSQR